MRDRFKTVDLALAFAAAFVITLAVWPKSSPRQIVRCYFADGGWETYSLDVNDPTLGTLKEKVKQWTTPESYPEYVTAKWQKEVAEFYDNGNPYPAQRAGLAAPKLSPPARSTPSQSVERSSAGGHLDDGPATATISDTVMTASYETFEDDGTDSYAVAQVGFELPVTDEETIATPSGEATQNTATQNTETLHTVTLPNDTALIASAELSGQSDSHYWRSVRESALASMQAIELKTQNAPIVFEGMSRPAWPQLAFHVAFLVGIVAACGYMHWLRLVPTESGVAFTAQPAKVLARIGTFGGVIVFALISSALVWV